jgi:putative ABC transport system ATP-binding protein
VEEHAAAIRLDDVSKTFGRGEVAVHALRGVDLEIARGEFAVVLGPSGSGKTTLLNLVGAIDVPTGGRVLVDGRDVGAMDPAERTEFRRSAVGFVFQFFNLVPTLTARENVELLAELTGADGQDRAPRVLEEVGLADRLDHFPPQLSGGEQQRVAIARALAKEAPILLCDEPTGELDIEIGRKVLELLRRLNRGAGRTVLMVTHNAVIGAMADRVVRLRSGQVVEDRRNPDPADPEDLSW